MLNIADLFNDDFVPVVGNKAEDEVLPATSPKLSLVSPVSDDEDDDLDTPLSDIGSGRKMVIETPLYDIHFKVGAIGNTQLRANETQTFGPISMLDAIADKEIMRVAYRSLQIQVDLFGYIAVADDTAPKASTAFDPDTGELLPEFTKIRTIKQKQQLEQFFAEAALSTLTVRALSRERDEMFPYATNPIQLAWNKRLKSPAAMYDTVPNPLPGEKSSIEEAIEYRRNTGKYFDSICVMANKQRRGPSPSEVENNKTAMQRLGF